MGLFSDIYNTVAKFFRPAEEDGEASKSVAANRLKLVLMQDRTNLTPKILEQMRGELIDLLSKYVELDKELLELNFEQEGDQVALMLSIPVIRAKDEEEIEAAIKASKENETEESEDTEETSEDNDNTEIVDNSEISEEENTKEPENTTEKDNLEESENKMCKKINIKEKDIIDIKISKKSLDARNKPNIYYIYEVDIDINNEDKILVNNKNNNDILRTPDETYKYPKLGNIKLNNKPIIVGSGPAGLFSAYLLAELGFNPIIIVFIIN